MLDWNDFLTADVRAGLIAYLSAQEEMQTIPAAANGLLRDALTSLGFIAYQELPEGVDDPDA